MSENLNNINNNDNFTNAVSGVERVTKKKGKKIALISGITAVAIVGGGAAAYNLSDFVKNQVNLRVMKPEKYYAWVTEENSKNFAQSVKESYSKSLSKMNDGQKANMTLKYTATDDFKDYALSEILGDDYGSYDDEESKMLTDIINNINEIAIGTNASVKDTLMAGNIFASLNGENLISADYAMDMENYDYFLRVPELTEQWLCVETDDSMYDNYFMSSLDGVMENPSEYLSPDELEDIIIRYTNVWNESVKDIELEKKESVDICDITVDYTVVSVEFTEADLKDLAVDYLEELKNDDIIKNIVVNKMEVCTEDEWISEIDEMITDLEEDDYDDSEVEVTFDTYIDPNGDIRGIKMYDESEEFFIGLGKSGDNVRGEMYFADENEKDFSIELYADENNGKYSGNIDFTSYYYDDTDEVVSIEFNNFGVVNEDMGYVDGGITLIIPDIDPITVDFASDGNSQDISYNINFNGKDYGTVTLTMSVDENAEVSVPSKDGAFIISDYMDSEPELEDYIPSETMNKFIYDILVKLGFNDEIAQDGADDITEELYWDYEDNDWETYDSYVDFDDFGGFDDDEDFTFFDEDIAEETSVSAENANDTWNYHENGVWQTGEADESRVEILETEQSTNE